MNTSIITFAPGEVSKYYALRVPHLKRGHAAEWRGACPIHLGKNENFAVAKATGKWFCHSTCNRGGDILDLEEELVGGDFATRKTEVFKIVGRIEPEYRRNGNHPSRIPPNTAPTKPIEPIETVGAWREIARYPYVNRDGSLLFEVIRFLKPDGTKTFTQVRPSGLEAAGTTDPKRNVPVGGIVVGLNAGKYLLDPKATRTTGKPTWKRANDQDSNCGDAEYSFRECPRVPYRLPELLKADVVYLPEGEKDVLTLEQWGLVASCNPGGTGNSPLYAGWSDYFRGKHIVILPDNDGSGRKHAAAVAAPLLSVAATVCVLELPDLPAKGDVTDWRDAGGTFERFRELTDATAPLEAEALSELRARWVLADKEPHHQGIRKEAADKQSNFAIAQWPNGLREEAYHGPAGGLVRFIEPHSEADPAAILIQFLVAFGNLIGRSAHFLAEADRHFMNLFTVLVGQTAKGRKGTSLGQVQRVLGELDPAWSINRIMSGLASGEGLIWAVRDEIRERAPIRKKGRVIDYEDVVSDPGEKDKRLLVAEPEFARVLQVTERESNTLSAIIRQSWDSGNLRILTKKQSARSTEAHISVIGHITKDELKRLLTDTAVGNGFANRFLWVCTRRSKMLPEGGALHTVDFGPIIRQVQAAADFARGVEEMRRDEQARAIWCGVYAELSEGKPGLLGSVTSRAEAQTMRVACIYALLDCSAVVRAEHLMAALEVWRYCEHSAWYIFGDALGDNTADEILRELRQQTQGITRNDIRELFNRNKSSGEIGRALCVLQEYGLARVERTREDELQKRPTERWFAVSDIGG